jgi:DNA-binding transcriptional MocR family regulator
VIAAPAVSAWEGTVIVVMKSDRKVVASEWLVERLSERSAAGISELVAALIGSGELEFGTRLPTVRDFAQAADTSIGTVLAAWNALREQGLIATHRRGGTIVTAPPAAPATGKPFGGWAEIDLAQSAPDISLQPELGDALLSTLDAKDLNVFGREHMTDRLQAAVEPTWPFRAEAWTTAGGGTEALLLATAAAAPPGSVVAVDEPLSPGFLDTLRDLELTPIGIAADDDGPTPESLRAALAAGAVAVVLQPGAPFAVRHSLTPARAEELAAVLADAVAGAPDASAPPPPSRTAAAEPAPAAPAPVWVVEDDSIGPLAAAEPPSLGAFLPDRVIRIRSYCKAYGIDVRTSVIAGAKELVDRSIRMRSFGVGSNSRILQNTLAYLVTSPAARDSVDAARAAYAARRSALLDALEVEGVTVHSGPGSLVVWVAVADETDAALALARRGIYVGVGAKSFVTTLPAPLIRISVTQLPDDPARVAELARAVADAASGAEREYFD